MLQNNQYLLMPHVPSRDNSKIDSSNSTVNSNETSEISELSVDPHGSVNHNFLMETRNNEHHIAIINDNDENYFEIFKTPMKFGTENNSEVTAQIGTTAHLPCTIHNVGEGVVSTIAVIFPSNGDAPECCRCALFCADMTNDFQIKVCLTTAQHVPRQMEIFQHHK